MSLDSDQGRRAADKAAILRRYVEETATPPAPRRSPVPGSAPKVRRPDPRREDAAEADGVPTPQAAARPSTPPIGRSTPRALAATAPVGTPADGSQAAAPAVVLGGKYRLGKLIAAGGLGEVFEAVHEVIGHRVAVKMIRNEFSANPELSARFLQEARAAGAVGHPGCVQVFDVGVSPDGRVYLVMELLDGEDLLALLRRQRRLSVDETAAICSDCLEALDATHVKGIIHRDLKPENIFLARGPRGERWVKLLDFGVARLVDDRQAVSRLTQPGTAVGTPYYMAPEQARGSASADGGADIYAMGVVAFECLTGRLPFEGATYNEVLAKVLSDPFPSARAFVPDIPAAIEDVICKATARKRQDRYATAREFAAALQAFRTQHLAVTILGDEPSQPGIASVPGSAPSAIPSPVPSAGSGPRLSPPFGTPRTTPPRPPRRTSSPRGVASWAPPASIGRQVGLLVAGSALSAALIAGGVFVGLSLRKEAGEPSPAAATAPVRAPQTVRVRLHNVPEGAEVRVDGREAAPEFLLPRSEARHTVEVLLDGRLVLTHSVRAASDVEIDLLPPPGEAPTVVPASAPAPR